ncbi:ATP-binding protein [Mangrovibrevibacter kandeliae]|uniref:ATP-binding protein n=1 Tax=Mangrovibrevibacter kandeliae TaxID=2968473 RepID=UPI00211912FA|nr:ATP-binding protein [Aurantimonas sp. CSK15Z-1]MCQ8781093.1 ATP-binding protein [Aurantimonas sp. CSK15Z-1]
MAALRLDSVAVRVIGLSTLWAIAAFVVVAGVISTLYGQTASRGFEDLLVAQLYNVVNSVAVAEDGTITGSPDLGDLRYSQPLSGWYWEVTPASANTSGRLASISLGPADVPSPPQQTVPFDENYRREYEVDGLNGQSLSVVETEVVLDNQNHIARFRVMGDAGLVAADVRQFNRSLGLYLGAFGLGSILINALAILFGLRPLVAVRRALAEVGAGRSDRLRGPFAAEIEPLAVELNAMIDNNRRIVERARTQVGNLAHSLKTPLAVLRNEAAAIGGERGKVVTDQTEHMRVQVQHYLERARLAAQGEGVVFRTPVAATLERLVRVIGKLNPELTIDFVAPDGIVFAGEQQDLEEVVGNLLENASKWTKSRIALSAASEAGSWLILTVEDDGPGLSDAEIAVATKRGQRLDEAQPGTGLGLSIVLDTVREYRGGLSLDRSPLGGLRAVVRLPQAS